MLPTVFSVGGQISCWLEERKRHSLHMPPYVMEPPALCRNRPSQVNQRSIDLLTLPMMDWLPLKVPHFSCSNERKMHYDEVCLSLRNLRAGPQHLMAMMLYSQLPTGNATQRPCNRHWRVQIAGLMRLIAFLQRGLRCLPKISQRRKLFAWHLET